MSYRLENGYINHDETKHVSLKLFIQMISKIVVILMSC